MIQTSTVKTIDHLDGFFPYLASVSELPTNESLGVYNEDLAPEVDLHLLPELSRQLVHHNVAIVPTLFFVQMWYDFERCKPGIYRNTVYLRPGFMTKWNGLLQMVRSRIRHDVQLGREILTIRDQIVRQLFHANVRILLGSGAYEVDMIPGFSLVDELLSIEKAGLSPFEALKTCTVNISDHFGLERGRVAIGKPADLILIKENPLHNLETLREIQGLFNNGRWFSKAMLDQLLLEAKIDD